MKIYMMALVMAFATVLPAQTPDGWSRTLKLDWINPSLDFENRGNGRLEAIAVAPCEVLAAKDTLAFSDLVRSGEGWPCLVSYYINERRAEIQMLPYDVLPCSDLPPIQAAEKPPVRRKRKSKGAEPAPPATVIDHEKWKGRKCEIKGIN